MRYIHSFCKATAEYMIENKIEPTPKKVQKVMLHLSARAVLDIEYRNDPVVNKWWWLELNFTRRGREMFYTSVIDYILSRG